MKASTNIQRSVQYLNKIFKLLNEKYFDNELEQPMITIQSSPTAYGHFTPWESWTVNDANGTEHKTVEINLGAGTIDRPIENVVCTLLHEMVHYYCFVKGIPETSNKGRYHNSRFKKEAEKRDLIIENGGTIGWSVTSPSEAILDFCIENSLEDIRIGRNEFTGLFVGGTTAGNGTQKPRTGKPKGSNSIKWICPCCHKIIRSTREVNVVCGDCGETFIKA